MRNLYDARGNRYFVARPKDLKEFGVPQDASDAAATHGSWARKVIDHVCRAEASAVGAGGKGYVSDGLLVGPFYGDEAFEVLIVNTDGSLAERSGNGLTIFSQYLCDTGLTTRASRFAIRVCHDRSTPITAAIEPGEHAGQLGFFVDMGKPSYGLNAVAGLASAVAASVFNGQDVSRVTPLQEIDKGWLQSVFVSVGNPHCVTFVDTVDALPSMPRLEALRNELGRIANSSKLGGSGELCVDGVNLQWAVVTGTSEIEARVFERGEGPTASSGSSATAVASAARHLNLVMARLVSVRMPGGTAPVSFNEDHDGTEVATLFGVAKLIALDR